MSDQTEEVIAFVLDRHPEIPRDVVEKCIVAFSEWVELELIGGESP